MKTSVTALATPNNINVEYTELTRNQKMQALSDKYYSDVVWVPDFGDYYTTSRNDLELYQVVGIGEVLIFTQYCTARDSEPDVWDLDDFLKGFGLYRVHVPLYILEKLGE